MTETIITRASLEELRRRKDEGKTFRDPNAPEGEDLGSEFWADAVLVEASGPRSVHLRLDPEVFAYFYETSNGKGHLTRMQNVLKAYVKAHKAA